MKILLIWGESFEKKAKYSLYKRRFQILRSELVSLCVAVKLTITSKVQCFVVRLWVKVTEIKIL